MEIVDESTDTGQIMSIERRWRLHCPSGCDGLIGNEREMPQPGTVLFAPTFKKYGAIFGKDSDGCFVKYNLAVVVAELADPHQIVLKGRHDFGVAAGKVEVDVCLS